MTNLRDISRDHYKPPKPYPEEAPTLQDINTSSLQRIADALEVISQNYTRMFQERNIFRDQRDEAYKLIKTQNRQVAAYKGRLKKQKKEAKA